MPHPSSRPPTDGRELELRFLRAEVMLCKAAANEPDEQSFLTDAARIIGEASGATSVGIVVANPHDGEFVVRALWPVVETLDAPASVFLEADDERGFWMPFLIAREIAGFVSFTDEDRKPAAREILLPWVDQLLRVFETQWAAVQIGSRYRLAIGSIDDALFDYILSDTDERSYTFATPQFDRLYGFSREQVVGPNAVLGWLAAGLTDEGLRALATHHERLRAGSPARTVFEFIRPDGETRWIREEATPRREPGGCLSVTGIVVDVTDQELAERLTEISRAAAQAESERKSALIATTSHELRTPLATVHGYAGLLKRELADLEDGESVERLVEFADTIEEVSEALLRIVDDLMDLSHLDSGLLALSPVEFDLRQTVAGVIDRYTYAGADVSLLGDASVRSFADRQRVIGVVDRLLSNAVKFGCGEQVRVAVKTEGGLSVVVVEDSGVGIPASQIELVFEPFVQADARLNRSYEGAGLGLSVANRLAVAMGGSIDIQSSPGAGTTVRLLLPATDPTSREDRSAVEPVNRRGRRSPLPSQPPDAGAETGSRRGSRTGR